MRKYCEMLYCCVLQKFVLIQQGWSSLLREAQCCNKLRWDVPVTNLQIYIDTMYWKGHFRVHWNLQHYGFFVSDFFWRRPKLRRRRSLYRSQVPHWLLVRNSRLLSQKKRGWLYAFEFELFKFHVFARRPATDMACW